MGQVIALVGKGGDWNLIKTVQQSRDTPCEEEHATIVGAHEDPP